jgi:antitoxin VapB
MKSKPTNGHVFDRPINMFPLVTFQAIELEQLNHCLVAWEHKMGALNRINTGDRIYHALFHESRPVAVTAASMPIASGNIGGGLGHLNRQNTIELSRLCAERSNLCRVALRLWREFVFPFLGYQAVISYQDADLHSGNTYRFDGWQRSPEKASSGIHSNGKRGRPKWIWVWPPEMVTGQKAPQ